MEGFVSALPLADGPAMYFAGSIMTFALPYGALIAVAAALYFLFRATHSGPKLKYLSPGHVASVTTREPGPAPVPHPSVLAAGPETAVLPGSLPQGTPAPETAAPPESAAPETGGGEA
jgi:hypothetical protein